MNATCTADAASALTRAAAPAEGHWLRALHAWPLALLHTLRRESAVVRVVVVGVRGSAPREAGVSMLVSHTAVEGTIGGGQLEWQALAAARALLSAPLETVRMQRMVLGAQLEQCCGGVVDLWMERYTRADMAWLHAAGHGARSGTQVLSSTLSHGGVERRILAQRGLDARVDQLLELPRAQAAPCVDRDATGQLRLLERLDEALPPLWLYGAGHVGHALARILMELPLHLTWIDTRAQMFPRHIPDTVQVLCDADPVQSVADAPAGARFLVLTHSHPLDYGLCRAILERGDFAWAGLIGSQSKAARFRSRFRHDGLDEARIARLVCPIGIAGIRSKWPAAIAVSVAAQLLQDIGAQVPNKPRISQDLLESACAPADCAQCGSPPAATLKAPGQRAARVRQC